MFPDVFLINLKDRGDRLREASIQLNKVDLGHYTCIDAVNGNSEAIHFEPPSNKLDTEYWNAGAAGLVKTTEQIIRHAKEDKLPYILIVEDDVQFADDAAEVIMQHIAYLPNDWEMLLLGSQICYPPEHIHGKLYRVKMAYCCHAYVVRESIYDDYLELLSKCNQPIDAITAHNLQKRGTTYAFHDNIAWQSSGFSNIAQREVSRDFLKPGAINYVYSNNFRKDLFPAI